MPVHIDDLQSTVEVQGDSPAAATTETPDEVSERMRYEQHQRDRERLQAEGYAD